MQNTHAVQAFSRTLMDLYHLADFASPADFPREVLTLLQPWIAFDGAVFGMGESDPSRDLHISHAHVHNRAESLLADYAEISASDPVTLAFLNGLAAPLAVDCEEFYGQQKLCALQTFAREHDLRHLMLFGDPPSTAHPGRWLVFYRHSPRPFLEAEAACLHAAWSHVSHAIDISYAKLLDRIDESKSRRASALVNRLGVIEAADPWFAALLREEWPDHEGKMLPADLSRCLGRSGLYRGHRVEIAIRPQDRYFVCLARRYDRSQRLTPGEQSVATRFASGMSAKEIARELGISPNTVRNQLASLYVKLDVHDKAALAQRLGNLSANETSGRRPRKT